MIIPFEMELNVLEFDRQASHFTNVIRTGFYPVQVNKYLPQAFGLPRWHSPANAGTTGDAGLIPGSGSSPRGGHDNLPGKFHGQRSLADYTVYRVAQSWTRLKQLSTHTCTQAFGSPIIFEKPQVRLGSLGIN